MAEQVRVIEAGGVPAKDRDGLHKRRGIWHATIRVNGGWREFSTGTRNWQQARTKRAEMVAAIEAGRLPTEIAKWPLGKVVDTWLASRTHTTAPNTQALERNLSRTLVREFPARTLAEVSCDSIRAYQAKRSRVVAPRTINAEMAVMRGMLKQAKLWGRLSDDYKPLKEPTGPGRALLAEEEAALFRAAGSKPGWMVAYYAAILAANTTMRGGEIKGLRLGDVNLMERTLTVRRASTKTDAGARLIPLNDAALWALARLVERAQALGASEPGCFLLPLERQHQTKLGESCRGTGFDASQPMRSWRTAWRKLTAAAGLPGLRFHDLRHHAISKLAEAGTPDQTLMAIAGHVSRAMLEHYSHIRTQAKRAAVNAISVGIPEPQAAATLQ
ncbi:MAG: tyrosine-type recombinase/integrase [Terriglobales bacterium]